LDPLVFVAFAVGLAGNGCDARRLFVFVLLKPSAKYCSPKGSRPAATNNPATNPAIKAGAINVRNAVLSANADAPATMLEVTEV